MKTIIKSIYVSPKAELLEVERPQSLLVALSMRGSFEDELEEWLEDGEL